MMSNLYQLSPVFHRTKASDIGVVDSMAFAKAHMHKFSVPLPDGVDYHFPGGEGAEPVTVSFAAWMVKDEDGSLVFEAGGPGRYAVLGSDTPFSVSAIIQPAPLPGDEKDGNAVYIVLLAAIPAAVLLALLLVFLYRKKRKAQDNPPAGGKDPSEPDGGDTKN